MQVSANTPKSGTGGSIPSGLPDAAQYTGKPNFLAISEAIVCSTSQKLNLKNIEKVKSNSLSNVQLRKLRSSRKAFHRVRWYSNDKKSPTLAYSGLILRPPVHFKDPNLVATYSWALTPTVFPKALS